MRRKAIFDAVRQMLGRGFRQTEVTALDAAIDAALDTPASRVPSTPSSVGERGLALIKRFEGCARRRPDGLYEAYPDPGTGGAPWTIGWGATGKGIGPHSVWTQGECRAPRRRGGGRGGRCPDYPEPVRRAGELPFQHRGRRAGDADAKASRGRLRGRRAGVCAVESRGRPGSRRADAPACRRSGALSRWVRTRRLAGK